MLYQICYKKHKREHYSKGFKQHQQLDINCTHQHCHVVHFITKSITKFKTHLPRTILHINCIQLQISCTPASLSCPFHKMSLTTPYQPLQGQVRQLFTILFCSSHPSKSSFLCDAPKNYMESTVRNTQTSKHGKQTKLSQFNMTHLMSAASDFRFPNAWSCWMKEK